MSDTGRREPVWFAGALAELRWLGDRPLAWSVRLDTEQAQRDAAAAMLTAREIEAFARTHDAPWRMQRRKLAKALLAKAAGCHPGRIVMARDLGGALRVAAPAGWYLSLAGQQPHALIGLGRGPLGVDCEPRDTPPAPEDAFADTELALLRARWPDDSSLALLAGWVAKEAHGKACGRARQLDPRAITLSSHDGLLIARSEDVRSIVHLAITPETVAALAESA